MIEQFPLGEVALLHLLSVSSICAARLAQDPQILVWLRHPDVCADARSRGRMLADLGRVTANASIGAQNFRALRLWKGREMLRIALREVAGVASLEETTAELSQLAEICVTKVFEHWEAELRTRLGSPDAELAVLALGKLGGRELNHSSDIDVIFLYSEEGQVSATSVTMSGSIASRRKSSRPSRRRIRRAPCSGWTCGCGPKARPGRSRVRSQVWRITMRLRRNVGTPRPDQGARHRGQRRARLRFSARASAVHLSEKRRRRNCSTRSPAIKRRIERDIVGHENLDRNVKLGTGGIREIEFVVQALQLLHGARHAFLQETSTLKALPVTGGAGTAAAAGSASISRKPIVFSGASSIAYRSRASSKRTRCRKKPKRCTGSRAASDFHSSDDLLGRAAQQTGRVRAIFSRVIAERPQDKEAGARCSSDMFRDQSSAAKAIDAARAGARQFSRRSSDAADLSQAAADVARRAGARPSIPIRR